MKAFVGIDILLVLQGGQIQRFGFNGHFLVVKGSRDGNFHLQPPEYILCGSCTLMGEVGIALTRSVGALHRNDLCGISEENIYVGVK